MSYKTFHMFLLPFNELLLMFHAYTFGTNDESAQAIGILFVYLHRIHVACFVTFSNEDIPQYLL